MLRTTLAHYMRQAFNVEQITVELADPKSIFLIAAIGRKAGRLCEADR